jgi:hypothetical protein
MPKRPEWVLRVRGKQLWYEWFTYIGPKTTDNIEKADKFRTRKSAMQSAAYNHWGCDFVVEKKGSSG